MGIEDVAAIVSQALSNSDISAVLTGGAVVSIYSKNEYQSYDLDFISSATEIDIARCMLQIGFKKNKDRYFKNPNTQFFVEFPTGPLSIGSYSVKDWAKKKNKFGTIKLLTPTHCTMDRLAGFYFWNDKQNLEQAKMIVKKYPVNLKMIQQWSKNEGCSQQYKEFLEFIK